jgi:hypothetical protein
MYMLCCPGCQDKRTESLYTEHLTTTRLAGLSLLWGPWSFCRVCVQLCADNAGTPGHGVEPLEHTMLTEGFIMSFTQGPVHTQRRP